MKSAVGYIRVSTEEQGKGGVSLEAQREKIRKYAAWKGLEVEIIAEKPISGSVPLAQRPDGCGLIIDVGDGKVTDIIVTKLDRLFRDLKDCVTHIEGWEDRVVLHLVDEGGVIDTSTPDGYLNVMVKALFAAYEVRVIRARTRSALNHKRDTGQVYNHIPYGFEGKDGRLMENEIEQGVIRQMRKMRSEGKTFQQIADYLNETGVPSKGFGKKKPVKGKWHPKTVRTILGRSEDGRAEKKGV